MPTPMSSSKQQCADRMALHQKLFDLWGPEDRWPVAWADILAGAVDWQMDPEMTVDKMYDFVLEAVTKLREVLGANIIRRTSTEPRD